MLRNINNFKGKLESIPIAKNFCCCQTDLIQFSDEDSQHNLYKALRVSSGGGGGDPGGEELIIHQSGRVIAHMKGLMRTSQIVPNWRCTPQLVTMVTSKRSKFSP